MSTIHICIGQDYNLMITQRVLAKFLTLQQIPNMNHVNIGSNTMLSTEAAWCEPALNLQNNEKVLLEL